MVQVHLEAHKKSLASRKICEAFSFFKRVSQKFKQYAPKGQKHIAQGNTLGENAQTIKRPVRAKALIINAFALTGRFVFINPYTQGVALGYGLLPLRGVLL